MRALLLLILFSFPGLARTEGTEVLRAIPRTHVCMQRNDAYKFPQHKMEIGKQTYYYCCGLCKMKLEREPELRTAQDPLTGKSIDKAQSFTAVNAQNKVFYFENEKNFKDYLKKAPAPASQPETQKSESSVYTEE
jgi:YHS domain-containing protein